MLMKITAYGATVDGRPVEPGEIVEVAAAGEQVRLRHYGQAVEVPAPTAAPPPEPALAAPEEKRGVTPANKAAPRPSDKAVPAPEKE